MASFLEITNINRSPPPSLKLTNGLKFINLSVMLMCKKHLERTTLRAKQLKYLKFSEHIFMIVSIFKTVYILGRCVHLSVCSFSVKIRFSLEKP